MQRPARSLTGCRRGDRQIAAMASWSVLGQSNELSAAVALSTNNRTASLRSSDGMRTTWLRRAHRAALDWSPGSTRSDIQPVMRDTRPASGIEYVLAVVEDQQHGPIRAPLDDRLDRA